MKTLKTLLSVFAIAAIFSTGAFAQSYADVNVSTTVQASLDLTPTAVNLGDIEQEASDIAANGNDNGDGSSTNVGVGASAGSLQIEGSSGVDIDVSWTTATLDTDPASDAITFTPSVYNGSTALTSGGTIALTGGDITLDVGGSLAAPSGTGSYSTANGSPITFTVQYN